jgi:1-acyl-sn-glycerol-3-phosphate acyltransferase
LHAKWHGAPGTLAAVRDEPVEPLPRPEKTDDLTPIRAQVYRDPRPAEMFDRFHERARTREPDAAYELVRVLTTLYSWTLFRVRGIAPENVPASGPVILAPNHSSFMDHFFLGAAIRRKVSFMAKSQLFRPPLQFIYSHGGVFPVRRGFRDEEAFITAAAILDRGGCLAMYCEGGRSRSGRIGDRARAGIGRLALESGATVVPVAIHGSARVRNWKRLRFPKVTVQYGEPFRYERVEEATRDQQQAVADDILEAIKTVYGRLDAEGREAAVARWRAERRAKRTVAAS